MLNEFPILRCATPTAWLEYAVQAQEILLIDHAHCEQKAALSALSLIRRYPEETAIIERMSRLAREELRHFEQVIKILKQRQISFRSIAPARYAKGLRSVMRTYEPARLVDSLIIGAFIEARSCERFSALLPYLDEDLAKFYAGLLASEKRHYQHYIQFAAQVSNEDIAKRVQEFSELEAELIQSPDEQFRFHSGVPSGVS